MVLLVIQNRRGNEHPRTCAPADLCTVVHPFDGFSARQFPLTKFKRLAATSDVRPKVRRTRKRFFGLKALLIVHGGDRPCFSSSSTNPAK